MKSRVLSSARVCAILVLLLTLALSGLPPATAQVRTGAAVLATSEPAGTLFFIENAGQFPDGARFQVRGAPQGTLWLAEDAIWLTVIESPSAHDARSQFDRERAGPRPSDEPRQAAAIKLSFVGANPHPRLEPFNGLETRVSFFTGNDPANWRADVPAWSGVRYVELYPGIDLELTGEQGRLLPRLSARSGTDLGAVRLRVEGADAVTVDADALHLSTAAGEASWPLLRAEGSVTEATVQSRGARAFEIATPFSQVNQNPSSAADNPADLLYGTFLGGSGDDQGCGIAVDRSGAAYVTGITGSSNFPTTPGAFDMSFNGVYGDAFIAKLNAAGSALDYATFLGGSDYDYGYGIAVDGSGAAYVTGKTWSADFSTTPGAFDTSFNGGDGDAFLAKLNAAGSALVYATYLGGNGYDDGLDIAADGSGAAYVSGRTLSADFPTTLGAFDTTYSLDDAFVAKLNTAGSALDYATFLGGSETDQGEDIAVDGSGAAYITGWTQSPDFPTTPGAFDTTYNDNDAFVVKLSATGSALAYATYLGGSVSYEAGIAVDENGAAYVTGDTWSEDFPTTPGAFDTSLNGYNDAFVVKLNTSGSGLEYATFLGGSERDVGTGIAVDGSGVAYITGYTQSSDFPTTPDAFDLTLGGGYFGYDAFVARLNAAGSALDHTTFLGGSGDDQGLGVAVGRSGIVYVTGYTESHDLPTTPGAFDVSFNGQRDTFLAKLAMGRGPVYSISGHVTDTGGQGIPDVTVSTTYGDFATTDASGAYTLIHLLPGSYTLTPSLETYRFDPVTRTAAVPPDATGQDFEGVQFRVYLPLVVRNH